MSGILDIAKDWRSVGRRVAFRVAGTIHRRLYRVSGGRVGGSMGGMPVLLLTTTGRKTRRERTWPLSYVTDDDRLLVIASALGQPNHPAWYLNLRTDPRVTIRLAAETRAMIAETAGGEERVRLWSRLVQEHPVFIEHQRRTSREIPVVILRPVFAPSE